MAKSEQTLRETETVIIWNETDEPARLWTASKRTRKDWESYGYKPIEFGSGWAVECPKDRIILKIPKKS